MNNYSILLVDDDPAILSGMGNFLEDEGYQISSANNGEKGIELLNKETFDLVITDMAMHPINGIGVLKKAKEINPDTMVMILTGYADLASAIETFREGADDYLIKPCDLDEIQYRLERCLKNLENKREIKRWKNTVEFERAQFLSLFDSIEDGAYVSDIDTHEILYVSQSSKDAFQKELIGGICYKDLQGLDSPCEFCTNEIILKQKPEPYRWEFHNPILNKDYAIVDRIIKWPDGRDVRFEIALDITERKQGEEELKYRIKFESIITSISTKFVGFDSSMIDDGINDALKTIGTFAEIDRAYVFLVNKDGRSVDNTHEWCAEGIESQIHNLKDIT